MKRFSIPFFLIVVLVQWSFSQSEFLFRGQSGYGSGVGLSANRKENGLILYTGYSYRGFIDAKLTYIKANGGAIQGGVLSPSISFYAIKQEDAQNIPTLDISFGFSHYISKTTETVVVPDTVIVTWRSYERVTESTINALKLGVTGQSRTGYWKALFFQPFLGACLSIANAGREFTLCGGVSIGTRAVHGPLLILTSSVERQSGLTTFMCTFGAVI
ncbi:MAG: hypothetical protein ABR936_15680 [Bacteroidota bacterium]|jgi:hypothetical protein